MTTTTVPIDFSKDAATVPQPRARIIAADDGGAAPRSSRYVSFVDDGKLFEGHLTVQSRSLKAILQHLVDRQEEQAIVLRAMHDQVTSLQARATRAARQEQRMSIINNNSSSSSKAGSAAAGAAVSAQEWSSMTRRVTALEQFVKLWGVQPKDVGELVQRHGEPVVTPDAYTAYLLELAPFRATRREARTAALSAVTTSGGSGGGGAAAGGVGGRSSLVAAAAGELGTAARRRLTALGAMQPSNAHGGGGDAGGGDVAQRALQTAEQAMTMLRELQQQRSTMPQLASLRRTTAAAEAAGASGDEADKASAEAAGSSGAAAGAVDAQARSDIAELHDYLQRKMTEIDTRLTLASLSASGKGGAGVAGGGAAHGATASRGAVRRGSGHRASVTTAAAPAPASAAAAAAAAPHEVIDAVARDDAAASLALIEELESVVDKRLRELAMSLANLSLQVRNNHNNNSSSTSTSSDSAQASMTTTAGADGGSERTPRRGKQPRHGGGGAAAATPPVTSPSASWRAGDEGKVAAGATMGGDTAGSGNAAFALLQQQQQQQQPVVVSTVDTLARDEVTSLAERVADMEDDTLRRWQTLEERLRVLGRACMSRPALTATAPPAAGGAQGVVATTAAAAACDRKAREDAALSLMRIAHVERDVQALRRLLQGDGSGMAAATAATTSAAASEGSEAAAQTTPLRDTYGNRVHVLEAEVQQRMADVNRAIALLRDGDKRHDRLVDGLLAASHMAVHVQQQQQQQQQGHGDEAIAAMTDAATARDADAATPTAATAATTTATTIATTSLMDATSSPQPASGPGRLVLHSQDVAAVVATTRARGAAGRPAHRTPHPRTPRHTHDGYDNTLSDDDDDDADDVVASARTTSPATTTAAVVTVKTSRLRSPDARVFCTPLVEQVTATVVSLPASTRSRTATTTTTTMTPPLSPRTHGVAAAAGDDNDNARDGVHTDMTCGDDATTQQQQPLPPHSRKGVTQPQPAPPTPRAAAAAAAAAVAVRADMTRAHARRRRSELLAAAAAAETLAPHAQPCVIANCAWCAAEADASRTASIAPILP